MDAILGFLNSPVGLTFVTLAWGLVVKYNPAFAKVPNELIPYMNAMLAILVRLAGPTEAHAFALGAGAKAANAVLLGIWQGGLSSLIYEAYVRNLVEKLFGMKKPR